MPDSSYCSNEGCSLENAAAVFSSTMSPSSNLGSEHCRGWQITKKRGVAFGTLLQVCPKKNKKHTHTKTWFRTNCNQIIAPGACKNFPTLRNTTYLSFLPHVSLSVHSSARYMCAGIRVKVGKASTNNLLLFLCTSLLSHMFL